jgi:hypothetical protein
MAAYAVSDDGAVVFGSFNLGGTAYGFRWTAQDGMQAYNSCSGGFSACSRDGLVAAGAPTAASSIGGRWTAAGAQNIPAIVNGTTGGCSAVALDGTVLYGNVGNGIGAPYLWDSSHGPRMLKPYLEGAYGLNLTGINLQTVTDATPAATSLVGECGTAQGTRGYLVRVPPPPSTPAPAWTPANGLPGVSGGIFVSTLWDPDGPGPQQALLVVGGSFRIAGDQPAVNIATLNLQTRTWGRLGWGLDYRGSGSVEALAVLPSGELVAAGLFDSADGLPAWNVAKWDGQHWTALGTTYGSRLGNSHCLAVLPDGTLIAGGGLNEGGGAGSNNLCQWDGTAWTPLAIGGPTNTVNALLVLAGGEIIATGSFLSAGGVPANRIAKWNGSEWTAFGDGLSDAGRALLLLPNGDLVVGGEFETAGGVTVNQVARWDGSTWSGMQGGLGGTARHTYSLSSLSSGQIAVGGTFTSIGGVAVNHVALWNGSAWSALSSGVALPSGVTGSPIVRSLFPLAGGELLAGGSFGLAGGSPALGIARWNGQLWSSVSGSINGQVLSLGNAPAGGLVAGGSFTSAGAGRANSIARFDGSGWLPLGSGLIDSTSQTTFVRSLLVRGTQEIYAGGTFNTAGGAAARGIARWDGEAWQALGSGLSGTVYSIIEHQQRITAGGTFTSSGGTTVRGIARWDGSSWSAIGGGLTSGTVYTADVDPDGRLFIAGNFTSLRGPSPRLPLNSAARWNGYEWSPLGMGLGGTVRAHARLPDGDLVVAGSFTTAGGAPAPWIAKWTGADWLPMNAGLNATLGTPEIRALAVLPNGELVVGGLFDTIDGRVAGGIARRVGDSWEPFGSGVGGGNASQHASVDALSLDPAGDLWIGGYFLTAGDQVSPYLARLHLPSCYANCDGSTVPPILNVLDFNCFLNRFAAGDGYANCDGSTVPPVLNVLDFNCFLNRFAAGCP